MKKIIDKLKAIPILGTTSIRFYRLLFPNLKLDSIIERYLSNQNTTIVQIGSNDGKTGDPIFQALQKHKSWKAIFVEPVPYLFERLKSNYQNDPRFIFENVAINDGKEQTFYSIKPEAKDHLTDLPVWYDQLGSFYKLNITKHLNGKLEPFIEEIKLKGITLENLFLKHSLNSIDLLHIDTEGYDWKILSQLNLADYKPSLILYEQKHLSESERSDSVEFLNKDYFIFDFGSDYLAINKNIYKNRDNYSLKSRKVMQNTIA